MSDTTDLTKCTATSLLDLYRRREASPVEVTEAVLDRIDRLNPVLNCFALVAAEEAIEAARASEVRWQSGRTCRPARRRAGFDQRPDPHAGMANVAG